jgi:hypothetical protein
MSSNDEQLYNMDSGSVLQRLGGATSALQRLEEGKLEASARIDAKKTQETETKESQEEGGLGIGIGSAGVFSGVVGLVKKRAMGIIKSKAKESLDKLVEKAKANKQALKDKLSGDKDEPPAGEDGAGEPPSGEGGGDGGGAGGHPQAQPDPNATPENPQPNSADSSTPQTTEAPADIETPRIQVSEPDTTTTTEIPAQSEFGDFEGVPARYQDAENESSYQNVSSQEDLNPIESRVQTRYNNMDGEAQSRSDATYKADPRQTDNPSTIEERTNNVRAREDSVEDEETNPDTTFKDPNLEVDPEADPQIYQGNTTDLQGVPDTTRNPSSFKTDNPDYPQEITMNETPARTETTTTQGETTTIQEADSVPQAPEPVAPEPTPVAPEPTPPAGGDVPTPPATGGSELQSQLSSQTEDAMATFKGNIKSQLNLSDEDAGDLISKIAGGGSDIEDIVGAGSDILSSMSGAMGGILGTLGATAEVLGPLSAIAGIGMGIYSAIEQGKEEKAQEEKTKEYQGDLQNLSNTTQLQTGSIAMPTMDTSQFRTGGMMNF